MNPLTLRPRARSIAAAALIGCGGLFAANSPALAATVTQTQTVGGVTVATVGLTLASSAAALTGVSPGSTATGTGAATIVDTGPWTLSVADQSTAATSGHPVAAGTGCSGSEASLRNPLTVSAVGALGTVTPSAPVTLSATSQTLASGTSSATVTTNYSDSILSTEPLITGCVYSLTAVYTLQG